MIERNRIYSLRKGSAQLNEEDRITLVSLLAKAGYCVRLGREKENKKTAQYTYFVEYWEAEEE